MLMPRYMSPAAPSGPLHPAVHHASFQWALCTLQSIIDTETDPKAFLTCLYYMYISNYIDYENVNWIFVFLLQCVEQLSDVEELHHHIHDYFASLRHRPVTFTVREKRAVD